MCFAAFLVGYSFFCQARKLCYEQLVLPGLNNSTTILSSNTRASDAYICNTEPQRVSITSSFPVPTETYPLASQNDLCYNGIYTCVLGSSRWSGWAAAISIFPLVCEIIRIVLSTVEAFSQLKSQSTLVKRWHKTTSQVVVSLKDTKMGWICGYIRARNHYLNLMYELNAVPYQQEVWTHFLQLFPLADHSL